LESLRWRFMLHRDWTGLSLLRGVCNLMVCCPL